MPACSKAAWVASQMGARAGRDQLMASQGMGWWNRRQAGELSSAAPRLPLVSCLLCGASRMVPATFPFSRERQKTEQCSGAEAVVANGQAIPCCLAAKGFGQATQLIQFTSTYPCINPFFETVPTKKFLFRLIICSFPSKPFILLCSWP